MASPLPPLPPLPPLQTPPRRRRVGLAFVALALLALGFAGVSMYRGYQLRDSCTGNGGHWNPERAECTFGGPLPAAARS